MKCKLKEIQIYKIKNIDRHITNNFFEVQIKRISNIQDQKIQIDRLQIIFYAV